jgi:hypothetical protein
VGDLERRVAVFRAVIEAAVQPGTGVILDGDGRPFHDALARPASPDDPRSTTRAT